MNWLNEVVVGEQKSFSIVHVIQLSYQTSTFCIPGFCALAYTVEACDMGFYVIG